MTNDWLRWKDIACRSWSRAGTLLAMPEGCGKCKWNAGYMRRWNRWTRLFQKLDVHLRALEVVQTALESSRVRTALQPQDRQLRARLLLLQAETYIAHGRFGEAEADACEAVDIRHELVPDSSETFAALSHLGESLLGQEKLAEAEPLLLEGYHGLRKREEMISRNERSRLLREAADRIVRHLEYTTFARLMRQYEPTYQWQVGEYLAQRSHRLTRINRGSGPGVLGPTSGGQTPGPIGRD